MTKRNKIIYWVSTTWLAVAMLASGLQQIFHAKAFVDIVVPLGYPSYFLYIIGGVEDTWRGSHFNSGVRAAKRMGVCRFLFRDVRGGSFAHRSRSSYG